MAKTHFTINDRTVCGTINPLRRTTIPQRTTCLKCTRQPEYLEAKGKEDEERKAAFMAQEPRTYKEPWKSGTIECSECGNTEFRIGDRTCYGHYENFHCANCGHVESRLTETGMSF